MDVDKAFEQAEIRLAISLNRMYLMALARVYGVHYQTMLIRHALGRV